MGKEQILKSILKGVAWTGSGLILIVILLLSYNALRHLVFWSESEDVEFRSADGTLLRGTLVKPSIETPYAAVVMLHGAGPESRRGPGYRVLTNAIVRAGVAVLLYDKRGVGESGGSFDDATYADFVSDAVAAVNLLASRNDIDPGRIGLHGNSESGWLTPEIAHVSGKVAFIFNRVGPALPWMENVIWEVRNDMLAAGIDESDIQPLLDVTMRRWQYYLDAAADPSLADGPERDAVNAELKLLIDTTPGAASVLPDELEPYNAERYADLAAEIGYDQTPYLEAIRMPIIYTFGEADINVPTAQSVEYLKAFNRRHVRNIEIVVIEGVGHAMAGPSGLFLGGYVPEFMAVLKNWYSERAVSPASLQP